MKKIRLFAIILIIFFLAGCQVSHSEQESVSSMENSDNKLVVFTSFYPLYDFAQKVGGEQIKLINMMPAGTDPHDWEPTAQTIAQLEKADVFIYHGAGFEHWVDKVLATVENPDLMVVEASKGVPLIEGNEHEDEHGHGGVWDSHTWLSISRAVKEMENIKDALISADPDNADLYENNFLACSAQFNDLDQLFRETLKPLPNKKIIVTHQAFGYLCADYGLTQKAIKGLTGETEPDPDKMAEIVEYARENKINTIFYEESAGSKVAEAIARELDLHIAVLNPLEALTKEQEEAGEDYISIMKQNLNALVKALQ